MPDRKLDLSQMPVQDSPCKTCPFEGENYLSAESYSGYVEKILNLESQHLCHSANNKKLCRGGRNIMLRVLCSKGWISEPTDAAFNAARKEVLGF